MPTDTKPTSRTTQYAASSSGKAAIPANCTLPHPRKATHHRRNKYQNPQAARIQQTPPPRPSEQTAPQALCCERHLNPPAIKPPTTGATNIKTLKQPVYNTPRRPAPASKQRRGRYAASDTLTHRRKSHPPHAQYNSITIKQPVYNTPRHPTPASKQRRRRYAASDTLTHRRKSHPTPQPPSYPGGGWEGDEVPLPKEAEPT